MKTQQVKPQQPNRITHWRTRNGDIQIKSMNDTHIQNAYFHAERKFMECHNLFLDYCESDDEAQIKKYNDLTGKWGKILEALEEEYESRGKLLKSLADNAEEGKFQILRNERMLKSAS